MKYVCLGYIEPGKLESISESERNALVDGCFTYDDVLRKGGHFTGGDLALSLAMGWLVGMKDGKPGTQRFRLFANFFQHGRLVSILENTID